MIFCLLLRGFAPRVVKIKPYGFFAGIPKKVEEQLRFAPFGFWVIPLRQSNLDLATPGLRQTGKVAAALQPEPDQGESIALTAEMEFSGCNGFC